MPNGMTDVIVNFVLFYCFWHKSPQRARAASCSRFLDHTQLHNTVYRTSLDEGSAHRIDLYQKTHSTHKRETSMPPAGFETVIPGSERP